MKIQEPIPSYQSSDWLPPPHHLIASIAPPPPPFGSRGGEHSLAVEGAGGANSDEGTDTLVFQE
jgi:hypothetical protein